MKASNHSLAASKSSMAGRILAILFTACSGAASLAQTAPNFGPNVYVITPSMSASSINATLNTLNTEGQFSTNRWAVLFMPGTYTGVEAEVGYYESIAGLGETPGAVHVSNGYLTSNQTDSNGNITTNFWRSLENMQITAPSGDTLQWGVSQGAPFRRMYVDSADGVELTNTNCGYASGGFMSDTEVTGTVASCSQQQWYTRNSSIGSWNGNLWNIVFSGVTGAPTPNYPTGNTYTVLASTPVSREKPFLYVDGSGNYWVFSPALRTNSSGTSWSGGGLGVGTSLPISSFFIATPSSTLAAINSALAAGQNLILTPGIYQYSGSIDITNANTIVLGLGYATLVPQTGTAAINVADVDGVQIAGLLIDAGPVNSSVLLQVGVEGASRVSHAANPTSINDVFLRIGGATAGTATTSIEIDSDNVILDNIWAWRADHGTDASWTGNVADQGLVVNGDNVTALGLAVEHYEQNQVVWNGEGGETIFYQSEMPYDVPSQSAWMDGSVNGYASYYVAPQVTTHQGYGLGVYSYFDQGINIVANSGIAIPVAAGVGITHAVTVFLSGSGSITNTIASDNSTVDNAGTTVESGAITSYVTTYGDTSGSCSAAPGVPSGPSATAASSSQIGLAWNASSVGSSCTASYNVYRGTTSGFTPGSANQISSGLTATSYTDTGLTAATTYYYVIEAADAAGSSAASTQASATTSSASASCSAVPAAPTGLAATASSASVIGLSWSAVTPPTNCAVSSYSIYGSTTTGFAPGSGNLIASGVTGTSYSNTGLAASTTYYYVVEAVDAAGSSTASTQASATTSGATSAPDFTLGLSSSSLTLVTGNSGTEVVTVTPENGFPATSTVAFSCSGLPTGATCAFAPSTVTSSGNIVSTLTVNTSKTSAASNRSIAVLPGTAMAIAFCFVGWKKRRGLQIILLLAVSAFSLLGLSGCAGKSSSSGNSQTSAVVVTAVSGSLQHTTTLSLTITSTSSAAIRE